MTAVGNNLYGVFDAYTGEWITYVKVTTGYNGTTITTSNEATYIDRVIYIKVLSSLGGGYAKRVLAEGIADVRWFGVVGNGTTDDFVKFQSAVRITALYQIPLIIPAGVTIYLAGKQLNVNQNADIVFKGGTITNGTIVGNKTTIQAGIFKIFDTSVTLEGTFNMPFICPQHYGAVTNSDSETFANDISAALQACVDSPINVYFPQGFYYISSNVDIPKSKTITLEGITELVSGTSAILPGHARVYSDQNEHLITIQSGGVRIIGGVFDVIGVTGWTKYCIRYDLAYEIWDTYIDSYFVGDAIQLPLTEGLVGSAIGFDMAGLATGGGCVTHGTFKGYVKGFPTGFYGDTFPDGVSVFSNSCKFLQNFHSCKRFYYIQGLGGVSTFEGLLQCADVLTETEKAQEIYPVELNSSFNYVNTFLWDVNLRDQSTQYTYKFAGYTFIGPFTQFHYSGIQNKEVIQAPQGFDNPALSVISRDRYGYNGTFISKLDSGMAAFHKRGTVTFKAYKGAGVDFDTDLDESGASETTDITITNPGNLFAFGVAPPGVTFTGSADLDEDYCEIVLTPTSGTMQWSEFVLYLYQLSNRFKRIQFIEHYSSGTVKYDIYPALDTTNSKRTYKKYINGSATSTKTIVRLIGNQIADSEIKILDLAGQELTPSIVPYIHIAGGQKVFGSLEADGLYNTSSAYTSPIRLGNYRLWVDGTGALRIKNGAPTGDTDGNLV